MRVKPNHYWGTFNLAFVLNRLKPGSETDRLRQARDSARATARAADARPRSVWLNGLAFQRLRGAGDSLGAHEYLRRAQAAASSSDFNRYLVAYWSVREALLDRDVVRGGQIVDRLIQELPAIEEKLSRQDFETVARSLINISVDLGRFRDARIVATQLPVADFEPMIGWALLTIGSPGAKNSLRELVTTHYPVITQGRLDFQWALYAFYLYQLDMLGELRDIAARNQAAGPASVAREIDGYLALGEGRVDDGLRLFQSATKAGFEDPWARGRVALVVADAWRARGELERATTVLESETNNWLLETLDFGAVALWVVARDRLADLYRSMGRTKEAETIDAELLKLLAVADADHPVLARIKARQNKTGF